MLYYYITQYIMKCYTISIGVLHLSGETSTSVSFREHNHDACTKKGMQVAEVYCIKRNLKLTPLRRKVLELLLAEHRALGAYTILDLLREAGFSSQPPVAYRALDFLVEHGFAHKIQRLNAFVACALPDTEHSPAFMICRKCEIVAETESSSSNFNLSETANATGFNIEQTVVEARGLCHSCTEIAQL